MPQPILTAILSGKGTQRGLTPFQSLSMTAPLPFI
jgi:hypothetical protein